MISRNWIARTASLRNTCLRRTRNIYVIEDIGNRTRGMAKEYSIIRTGLFLKGILKRTEGFGAGI